MVSRTFLASSIPPSPPSAHTFDKANSQPASSQCFLINSYSSSVSVINELSVTITGTPNLCIFSMCLSRLTIPFFNASRSGLSSSFFGTPALYLRALTVATITAAAGLSPAYLHLISKNFSAPRSAPKPASVIA